MSEEPLPPRTRVPMDCRGGDLVSRLLAATPPYLYAAPLGAHSYFFSEMLRSLVQARETARSTGSVGNRRARKRPWVSSRSPPCDRENWVKKMDNKPTIFPEKPLELTTGKPNHSTEINSMQNQKHSTESILQNSSGKCHQENMTKPAMESLPQPVNTTPTLPADISSATNDLILPPPPPMWYPPLYPPPYGIDPLHFFIDLRVSGHIYDRKKDVNGAPTFKPDISNQFQDGNSFQGDKIGGRTGSAFSVPIPRGQSGSTLPVNLTNVKRNDTDVKIEQITNTNYVMQNLSKIYGNITDQKDVITVSDEDKDVKNDAENQDEETEEAKRKRCKDLRALIGLELVVDYCNSKEDHKMDSNSELSNTE